MLSPVSPWRRLALAAGTLVALATTAEAQAQPAVECVATPRAGWVTDPPFVTSPDGSVWFGRIEDGTIAHWKPDGTQTSHRPEGAKPHELSGMVLGPDGGLWYSTASGRIARLPGKLPARVFQVSTAASFVRSLVNGPDKALWFVNAFAGSVGRVTLDGQVKTFQGPPLGAKEFIPSDMALGRDGHFWITARTHNAIYRMTTSGVFKRFDIATPNSQPERIAAAPDGSLWFTLEGTKRLGRITPEGRMSEVDVGPQMPTGLDVAKDGTVWFTLGGRDMAGRIKPQGVVEKFPCAGSPSVIRVGPDGVARALGDAQLIVLKTTGARAAAPAPAPDAQPPSAGLRNVTDTELDRAIAGTPGLLVVHVTSDDSACTYCIRANPVFEQFAAANARRAAIVRVSRKPWTSVLQVPAIAKLQLGAAPTTLVYRDGKLLREVPGALPLDKLQREVFGPE